MAYVLSSARPAAGFALNSIFAALAAKVENAIDTRANRKALRELLTMDDARLSDLGISRADIRVSLTNGTRLTRHHA